MRRQIGRIHLVHAVIAERHVVIGFAAIVIGNEHLRHARALDDVLRRGVLRPLDGDIERLRALHTHVAQTEAPMRIRVVDAQIKVLVKLDADGIFFRDLAAGAVDDEAIGCDRRRDCQEEDRQPGATGKQEAQVGPSPQEPRRHHAGRDSYANG